MSKPKTFGGYDNAVTEACERVLVTLLRGLGPWKDSVFLVGGLTPRYLVRARPPEVPAHAGTGDVDVVVDLAILADTEAYRTLEENLRMMGFDRAENDEGRKQSWRWKTTLETGTTMILEFLADDPERAGGKVQELPAKGKVSALNIPHASMVFDFYESAEITAELLGDNGVVTETVRYADVVSFTCLKAFAFESRFEPKDAHDLVYCLNHVEGGTEATIAAFSNALETRHRETIHSALGLLATHFCDDDKTEGYRKDGPVAFAKFDADPGDDEEGGRDRRVLRQRRASATVAAIVGPLLG
ncbi:MAG: antitoxin [Sphingomonas sp.]|jgi:hypothetical protein|uniref:hypothetical protein n=1 Tax=unclassified Sphingomonas TaxID=196159 RepID=UPI00082A90B9|nr:MULTISPECIES: hypothetical protein [unclassified Sphingomonas]MBX9860598.1 antitoxin [Sphingomonas sp.]